MDISKFFNAIVFDVQSSVAYAFLAASATGAYLKWKQSRKWKKLKNGIIDGHECVYTETIYAPTGNRNPDTQKEIVEQRIRSIGQKSSNIVNVRLSDIFDVHVNPKILTYIDKAAKLCTAEEPLVFQHLQKVIPEDKYEYVIDYIARCWQNYFSAITNPSVPQTVRTKDREVCVEKPGLPLLINEVDADYKRYRVFWVDPENMDNLPNEKDVLFEKPHHDQRLETMHVVAKILKENPWIVEKFSIKVQTGEIVSVAEPPPIPEAA